MITVIIQFGVNDVGYRSSLGGRSSPYWKVSGSIPGSFSRHVEEFSDKMVKPGVRV